MDSRTIDLDGPVNVVEYGGEGRTILLVHGIGSSHANFTGFAERMTAYGRVVAVDLVGFGHTPPAGRSSDLRTNRRLLVGLVRREPPDSVVMIGTSMGGLLTMLTADAAPDRLSAQVLIGPGQPKAPGVPVDPMLAVGFVALATPGLGRWLAERRFSGPAEDQLDEALARLCHDPGRVPDRARQALLRMTEDRRAMEHTADAWVEAGRSMVRELRRRDGYETFVARLRPPTLLVQGARDQLVAPRASRYLAGLRPDWRYVELPDAGHSPQLEVPERLAAIVGDWLGETLQGS